MGAIRHFFYRRHLKHHWKNRELNGIFVCKQPPPPLAAFSHDAQIYGYQSHCNQTARIRFVCLSTPAQPPFCVLASVHLQPKCNAKVLRLTTAECLQSLEISGLRAGAININHCPHYIAHGFMSFKCFTKSELAHRTLHSVHYVLTLYIQICCWPSSSVSLIETDFGVGVGDHKSSFLSAWIDTYTHTHLGVCNEQMANTLR